MNVSCSIYEGAKKPGSYLYVEQEGNFTRVPGALLEMLGTLRWIMNLELSSERKLVQADVSKVMQQLREHGYYFQMQNTMKHTGVPQ